MPFIKQWRRQFITEDGIGALIDAGRCEPGDRCYVHYKKMVDRWRVSPCWTTAHEIAKDWAFRADDGENTDDTVARWLAWEVFWTLHVIPYELKKREENGDI